LRCPDRPFISLCSASEAFNSLFEMPTRRPTAVGSPHLRPFNSLFEMRVCADSLQRDLHSCLSILYLRCAHLVGVPVDEQGHPAFNSLFEMPDSWNLYSNSSSTVVTFNSLFEMPRSSSTRRGGRTPRICFQFSI